MASAASGRLKVASLVWFEGATDPLVGILQCYDDPSGGPPSCFSLATSCGLDRVACGVFVVAVTVWCAWLGSFPVQRVWCTCLLGTRRVPPTPCPLSCSRTRMGGGSTGTASTSTNPRVTCQVSVVTQGAPCGAGLCGRRCLHFGALLAFSCAFWVYVRVCMCVYVCACV